MKIGKKNSYKSLKNININGKNYKYYSLSEAEKNGLKGISKLPKSLKVILENLLRYEDEKTVTKNQIDEIRNWLKNKKFEALFHFAAVVPTSKVLNNYAKSKKINYIGTKLLIDEVQKNQTTKWFLFTSTSHVYKFAKKRITENSTLEIISIGI